MNDLDIGRGSRSQWWLRVKLLGDFFVGIFLLLFGFKPQKVLNIFAKGQSPITMATTAWPSVVSYFALLGPDEVPLPFIEEDPSQSSDVATATESEPAETPLFPITDVLLIKRGDEVYY